MPNDVDFSHDHDDPVLSRTATPDLLDQATSELRTVIPELHLTYPRSYFQPFTPPAPLKGEAEALRLLRHAHAHAHARDLDSPASSPTAADGLEFVEMQLDDFSVYCDTRYYPCELRPLHQLDIKRELNQFYFDGILSCASTRVFVRRVPISTVPIGNYHCLDSPTVRDHVWLQSAMCKDTDTYYRLGCPAKEYRRFFDPFIWIADLAKHFVDFLFFMEARNAKVSISHFRHTFKKWLVLTHGTAPAFTQWLKKHPSNDFRTSIIANLAFLWKEYTGVLGHGRACFHSIWAEVWNMTLYPSRPCLAEAATVTTPYIFGLFSHLPFGSMLRECVFASKSSAVRDSVMLRNHLEPASVPHDAAAVVVAASCDATTVDAQEIRKIKVGDTISTKRDDVESGTVWEREVSRTFADIDRWFALVQKINQTVSGSLEFEVLWYYRSIDTICGLMKYPWENELFLSDHCSCTERYKIQQDQVLAIHTVEFGGDSSTKSEFFCRQVYISQDRKWISLQDGHLRCPHTSCRISKPEYQLGDTLLIQIKAGNPVSEPCELIGSYVTPSGKPLFQFRRLLRRRDVDSAAATAPCNELVYSNQAVQCYSSQIIGRCSVRFFKHGKKIPAPYSRDGMGSFFFITHQEVDDSGDVFKCAPMEEFPKRLRQGLDPKDSIPQLFGLDLFCGGGNFGRGLEEGGAVQMKWANDLDATAVHTYMANCKEKTLVDPFLGSIDELNGLAMDGKFTGSVPTIGTVDFIAGGSPCPGFSRLTNDKTTIKQRKNQSLVAAFASSVDIYRPKYGILENVPGIVQNRACRDEDVFSQLMCAIVGMGYQAQFLVLDASSFGASQRRTRVFLIFAAPGCRLPKKPQHTHSHPPHTQPLRLGRLPTGESLAEREFPRATPFTFVTAAQATKDLPKIYDGLPGACIPFPDHRVSIGISRINRSRIALIPTRPWGTNFAQARRDVLTPAEISTFHGESGSRGGAQDVFQKNTNAFGRLYPSRLLETIVTSMNLVDRKSGRWLHWDENRPISIMEARRAQGFLDDEVLLGSSAKQYKIVGNSVARQVAFALGVAVREAWAESGWGAEPFVRRAEEEDDAACAQALPLRGRAASKSWSAPPSISGSEVVRAKGLKRRRHTSAPSTVVDTTTEGRSKRMRRRHTAQEAGL
ncbi:uncharacterized protein UV8b_05142 [Ustilaginoidea virens]|uniref:Cytosine-specific methyltransferase n=1 Tax=Ustilaginoidea virens TaxID=1159556 RepID=A0A1B5L944_USTVR|nr:uncharacterized protein UV8b_05142 [Ustilaginoidea virens]QUC20901.1 hypothetical protein UV8b_05142 [Ustilaginoidea virens]GAO19204.1 hypothetical protein UVI_02007970 [Ustilaginoidea virens]